MAIDNTRLGALLADARFPEQLTTQIFAAVIARDYAPHHAMPIAGLSIESYRRLLKHHFPYLGDALPPQIAPVPPRGVDEFTDTLALLLANQDEHSAENTWLAHAIATASLAPVPLWQALGLPGKPALSGLIQRHFRTLYKRNPDNLPWKRVFYRELARAAGVGTCAISRCADCAHVERCRAMDDPAPPTSPPLAA